MIFSGFIPSVCECLHSIASLSSALTPFLPAAARKCFDNTLVHESHFSYSHPECNLFFSSGGIVLAYRPKPHLIKTIIVIIFSLSCFILLFPCFND